jgi:hypothetical protein
VARALDDDIEEAKPRSRRSVSKAAGGKFSLDSQGHTPERHSSCADRRAGAQKEGDVIDPKKRAEPQLDVVSNGTLE